MLRGIKIAGILLLLLPIVLHAQDWRCAKLNDTTYYNVTATGVDSARDGYLRSVWIDSSVTLSGQIVSYFYPSVRLNAFNQLDTVHGDTWLGNKSVRDGGDEYFFNQIGDTIRFRTWANSPDSWLLCHDTNNIDYIATIISADTLLIDGVLDSIKKIQIQAYSGTTAIPSIYNALPVVLSKEHGFIEVFEFYCFPYQQVSFDSTDFFPFPLLPLAHHRMDREKTLRNYKHIDLNWKYVPGNEWQFTWDTYESSFIKHDSIISATYLGPDSVDVLHFMHDYFRYIIHPPSAPPYDTSVHTTLIKHDTIKSGLEFANLRMLSPEHKQIINSSAWNYSSGGSYSLWYRVREFCNGRLAVQDRIHKTSPLSGYGTDENEWFEGFGKGNLMHSFFQITQEAWGYF